MIIVVGAGPAGLAAALVAARSGHDVTVIEAADGVGGMTASHRVGGQSVDQGSHRLHPAMSADVEELLVPLLGSDLQRRERSGRVRIAQRWLGFPLRTGELLRGLPRSVATRMAFDALSSPLRRMREDTFAEFVRAGLGPTVLDEFYGPYAEKVWGRSPEGLAGDIARRRIATTTPSAMARRLLRVRSASGRQFLYPRGGFGQIAERLAEAAVDEGVDLRLQTPLTSVESNVGTVEVRSGSTAFGGSSLLSTVPLAILVRAIGEEPPRIDHRGLHIAHFVIDRPRWTRFDAHYLPGPETIASRVSEPKNYRDSPDDPIGTTAVCVEVPTSPGDRWWDASTDELTGRILDDLDRVGLPVPAAAEAVSRRIDRVYPVYGPGADPLDRAEALLGDHPNVVSFGRGGLINADNTHHAIDMGIAAARSVGPSGHVDQAAWRVHRIRFSRHVVED